MFIVTHKQFICAIAGEGNLHVFLCVFAQYIHIERGRISERFIDAFQERVDILEKVSII